MTVGIPIYGNLHLNFTNNWKTLVPSAMLLGTSDPHPRSAWRPRNDATRRYMAAKRRVSQS